MTHDEDYAVILGVQKYPGLTDLNGPENDARAFHEWVVDPAGGKVPGNGRGRVAKPGWSGNVRMILSSDYFPFDSLDEARPILNDIQHAFINLYDLAEANAKSGGGLVAGRRLYIYMAGHGIEPQNGRTALLMANAKPRRFGFHVLGRDYAEFFSNAGFFEEVLLFMDCCRDYFPLTPLTPIPFDPLSDPTAPDRVRYLHGFGTKWKRRSRERLIDGKVRGIFTTALLEGLRGGASDLGGRITAALLRNYLNETMFQFLDPMDLADPRIPKQPEFNQFPSEGEGLIIAESVPPVTYNVTIVLPEGADGAPMQIRGPKLSDIAAQTIARGPTWSLKLPRGLYLAQSLILGREADFEVKGRGGTVHVQL
jgi:hypothetical protein